MKLSSDVLWARILVKLACMQIFFPKDTCEGGK